ncbi:thioredoxin family protein [Haladaptatus sp. F3-133]|jgi:thioredoxin 1|uniref:Thioredoxin family protein n=1 Tax=Halorutilus salinus TaxID=2487751 RepID=A0A9Q4C3G0_9EURY|nr:thioredoxin family protein [Halorutilus salinus]MCX2818264.1 thioredoxin family protein [Halorutilus salinus]
MGTTVKDFHADWCGPCKKQDPIIDDLEEEYPDIEFEKVDVDESPDVAQEYGVRSVPTIVVEKDGEIVEKFIGLTQANEIEGAL